MRIILPALIRVAVLVAGVLAAMPAAAQTRIATWNVLHLGWDNEKDYAALSEIGSRFSLMALQEVMSEDAAMRFERAMEARTGVEWELLTSQAIGRGSYREMYAFLWRPDMIEWTGGAVVYVDDRDVFAREPFSAQFRTADGYEFVLASVHLIWGDEIAARRGEARAMAGYRSWLEASFEGADVYIAGDFNLEPDDAAWGPVGEASWPLVQEGATTLSAANGRFISLYDNIWVPSGRALPVAGWGVLPYPAMLGMDHADARRTVSDHAPVWMEIDVDAEPALFPALSSPVPEAVAEAAPAVPGAMRSAVVASSASDGMIYHIPGCPFYDRISASNLIAFPSEADAVSRGYQRAKNCR